MAKCNQLTSQPFKGLKATNHDNVAYCVLPYRMASATLTIERVMADDVIAILCMYECNLKHCT